MARARNRSTTPTEEQNVNTETTEPTFLEPEDNFAEPDADVDAPAVDAEDVVATQPVAEGEKPAKEKKESTRAPVPEGKVSPVAFAKLLSKHLSEKRGEEVTIAPQVVYSYIKNNGPESKNPFPAEKAEGRAAVVDAEAALAWWDEKDKRVEERKANAAEKAAKKADKDKKAGETVSEVQPQAEIVEAE